MVLLGQPADRTNLSRRSGQRQSVYGLRGLQDNNGWCGPSNSLDPSGIQNKYWIITVGGDGTWGIPEPDDPNWIWSDAQDGALTVYNRVTQDQWSGQPYLQTGKESWELATSKYRFNWESPIAFAPWRSAGRQIIGWYGGNVVFQTTDRGRSWTIISPDLTRNDKAHQNPAGGPHHQRRFGRRIHRHDLDIEASQRAKGEIWVGTDDGLVQLTRDGGKHWSNVTPAGAPQYGRFATVAPSTLVDGTAYAIEDDHEMGDSAPWAFVTHDFGRHWTKIVDGLPPDQWARAIRPDIHDRNLVYLGNEEGICISFDGGAHWQSFQNDLPKVSVHDIRMQPRDRRSRDRDARPQRLHHGRRAAGARVAAGNLERHVALYAAHGVRVVACTQTTREPTRTTRPTIPPYGVMITFYQKEPQKGAPSLDILDSDGRVIRSVSGTHKAGGKDAPYVPNESGSTVTRGISPSTARCEWNGASQDFLKGPQTGPGVPPGNYAVRMTLSGHTYVQRFTVGPDLRSRFTQAEYQQTFNEAMRQMARLSKVDTMLNNLDDLKKALASASDAAKKANDAALTTKLQDAETARQTLYDTLVADVRGEGTEDETKLQEDVLGTYFSSQGLITPAVTNLIARVDVDYRAGIDRYNTFVTGVLPGVNSALKAGNQKALTTLSTMTP